MTQDIPVVGQREPCPCGSGKRYKNCHGRDRDVDVFVARPFEGINGEAELIAMSELLASATCDLTLIPHPELPKGLKATLVTVLPGRSAALRTDEKSVLVALQTQLHSSDRSADIARAIITAAQSPIGEFIAATASAQRDVRLQDLLAPTAVLAPTVKSSFQWWHDLGVADPDIADDRDAVADMNESNATVARIGAAAFLIEIPDRPQVRMVLPDGESTATDAFARLVAAGEDTLGEGSRWLGNFRTCGLLAPVWDVPQAWDASHAKQACEAFMRRYRTAASATEPLTSAQRQSRATVVGKFVTLR